MAMRETNPSFMNGVPELLILRLLEQEEMYGYEDRGSDWEPYGCGDRCG